MSTRDFLRSSGSNRHVSVDKLIGPEAANYGSVLEHLLRYPPYDILHFSGHCEYVKEDPASSGWLFSKGKKISAYELTRVGCVPGFVFSNACSSGVVPADVNRLARRAVPSFAEAFFKQGVKNFVCTAWPVADVAARDFACGFYRGLLGSGGRRPSHYVRSDARGPKSHLDNQGRLPAVGEHTSTTVILGSSCDDLPPSPPPFGPSCRFLHQPAGQLDYAGLTELIRLAENSIDLRNCWLSARGSSASAYVAPRFADLSLSLWLARRSGLSWRIPLRKASG